MQSTHPSRKVPALNFFILVGTNAFSVAISQATDSHYHEVVDDVNYKSLGIIF